MSRLFVYGVTAVGKSTWAKAVSQQRQLHYIDGDFVRLHEYIPSLAGRGDRFAHSTTKAAWKRYGLRTPAHIHRGLVSLRKGINDFVDGALEGKDNFVFDAAYVDPVRHQGSAELYLLVCGDRAEHWRRMLQRDAALGRKSNEIRFGNARALQAVLIQEAKQLGVTVIDVSARAVQV